MKNIFDNATSGKPYKTLNESINDLKFVKRGEPTKICPKCNKFTMGNSYYDKRNERWFRTECSNCDHKNKLRLDYIRSSKK